MFDEALFDELIFDAPPQTGVWELIQTAKGWAILLTPFPKIPTKE